MTSLADRYKTELVELVSLGQQMMSELLIMKMEQDGELTQEQNAVKKKLAGLFDSKYQRWYTESLAVIRQLIPSRLDEFEEMYQGNPRRKDVSALTFTMKDWQMGARAAPHPYTGKLPFDDLAAVTMRFKQQIEILKTANARFESSLLEIRQLMQADIFDSEIEAAWELHKNGYLRAAGIVAGVVLEAHLSQVCSDRGFKTRKKTPSIADFNDLLKNGAAIDVPGWRSIQRLGDLRNLCGHKKTREPTDDEVAELIAGADKVIKTVS
jgi:hypothetical protein